jgi:simple sugar transport system ATP-binding protein
MSMMLAASSASPLLEMRNIWKSFPGVIANKATSFELRSGEIHSLLGENGAGKTTLMNVLSGLYQPDDGEIIINGRPVDIHNPLEAIQLGIGMVHQHFRLVDNLTVAENIHLGWRETPHLVTKQRLAHRLEAIISEFGFICEPSAKIEELSVGEQQRVEIVKALARGATILILDEPTSVLTPQEAEELFRNLRLMTEAGRSVIFISHKLEEVLSVSDRITILRHGRNIITLPRAGADARMLAKYMVGEQAVGQTYRRSEGIGDPVLELREVTAINDQGLVALDGINLTIRRGELLGVVGVSGNGQRELAEVITGLRRVQDGQLKIDGIDWTGKSAASLAAAGVGHIPEDRKKTGLMPNLPILENAILREYRRPPIRRGPWLRKHAAAELATRLVREGDVRTPSIQVAARVLSGGNQQKLLVQREIAIASRVLVAMHPTRGLDVAATEAVLSALIKHRDNGVAVLLISEDLDEVLSVADRVIVMYEGSIVGSFPVAGANREEIGLLMGGSKHDTGCPE